ncbi:MAG: hypothetical protein ABI595_15570 [Actinomycetota bacterium]
MTVGYRRGRLLVFGLFLLAACSGTNDPPSTSEGRSPSTDESVSTTPVTDGLPLTDGDLDPGTYTFEGFGEPMSFSVGEGWSSLLQPKPGEGQTQVGAVFILFNADAPAANLAFSVPTRVVDPQKAWDETGNLIPVPDDLIAWFADHPMLQAEEPFATTLGGRDAKGIDYVVADAPKAEDSWPPCGSPCVVEIPFNVDHEDGPIQPGGDFMFASGLGEHDREIVVEVGGQQLLVSMGGPSEKSFEMFLPIAEDVLDSIVFG